MGDIIRDSMHVTFPRSRAPPGLRTLRAPHQAPGPTRTHHTPLATSPSHNSVTAQGYPLPLHCYRHPATAPSSAAATGATGVGIRMSRVTCGGVEGVGRGGAEVRQR